MLDVRVVDDLGMQQKDTTLGMGRVPVSVSFSASHVGKRSVFRNGCGTTNHLGIDG